MPAHEPIHPLAVAAALRGHERLARIFLLGTALLADLCHGSTCERGLPVCVTAVRRADGEFVVCGGDTSGWMHVCSREPSTQIAGEYSPFRAASFS